MSQTCIAAMVRPAQTAVRSTSVYSAALIGCSVKRGFRISTFQCPSNGSNSSMSEE